MKSLFKVLFIGSLLTTISVAQSKNIQSPADFSGTWILDKKKSIFSFPDGGKINDLSDAVNLEDYTLVITQKDPEIRILQSFSFRGDAKRYEITLFFDKRGEINQGPHKMYDARDTSKKTFELIDVTVKSKTSQKNNKLLRMGSYQFKWWGTYNAIVAQTFELSNDGLSLSLLTDVTFMVDDPLFGNQKSKLVFTKQQ
jgi:hypothetical protein